MITSIRLFRPVFGKAPELRTLLTEWVRTRQHEAVHTALLQRAYSSQPVHFISVTRDADLAALQERTRQTRANDAFRALQARLNPLLASPATARYYETLVPVPPRGSSPHRPEELVARRRYRPAIGRAAETERLLREWTEHLQSQRHRVGLQRRILSDDGPALVAPEVHSGLVAYGAFVSDLTATEDFHALLQKLTPLLETHVVAHLFEVVVHFPS